jgi:acetyltransferase-like isoleucine patch superfamily enzyme
MIDYRLRFKRCGRNVDIAPDAHIANPERLEIGDDVRIMRGFTMIDGPRECRIGSNVTFYPNCFIQGSADRLLVENNVDFFPNTYISTGGEGSFIEIGHHTHFAPGCVLYGWGGLRIGPNCNIAAHCVFATVGHDQRVYDGRPMCTVPAVRGPITLEEDVWLCAHVTVTANTTIAKGCIIGANAVVTRDTEPMGLYVGVPARRMRDRAAGDP